MELTRHFYESSEDQRLNQQINEIHQRVNKVKANNLPSDHEPAKLGSAAFPPLNGVAGEDQNDSDAIPPVPTGTQSWQQCENPSELKSSNVTADEPSSEDPAASTDAADVAAAKSDLDVGQVSSTTESTSTSTTMSMNGVNGQEPHSKNNLSNPNPENPSHQQQITSSSTSSNANADEPPEDPSTNIAAAVNGDWSPLDDDIEILLPGSDKAPSREEVDAYINRLRRTTKKRLPVFAALPEEEE